MISNRKKWSYLVLKKIAALRRRINSKNNRDFIVWIVFITLEQKKFEWHKKVCENKDFYNVIMTSEYTNILESNQYQKSQKVQFVTYAEL